MPYAAAAAARFTSPRSWRAEIARKRGVPAYVVLHDATIDGIASSRPATLTQLRGIAGIGDKKLEHYGDELIALVKRGGMSAPPGVNRCGTYRRIR